jgi:16S rRNA (uracil1498-N3)-methyltransferase
VTRALFLAAPGAFTELGIGRSFTLGGAEGRHAGTVRRIRAGEWIDVADGAGVVATCEVIAASKDALQLRISALSYSPLPAVRLTLVQALAKGGRDEQAIETATEVGVDCVVPWQASRSVVRWDGERGERARRRWESVSREATKQSRRLHIPAVEPARTTAGLSARLADASLALVLHESAKQPLTKLAVPSSGEIIVVAGPEGGITDDEIAELTSAGGIAVRLGPEVLRASTAGPVALAYLVARLGRWS